jgi:hypothetical protein
MFGKIIFELNPPISNPFPDNRKFSKKFNLMTEDKSLFENIIKGMNNSQNLIEKNKFRCENPNCKSAFCKYENCFSCNKTFCNFCLISCDTCPMEICKFCTLTFYGKFKDYQICPNCSQNSEILLEFNLSGELK